MKNFPKSTNQIHQLAIYKQLFLSVIMMAFCNSFGQVPTTYKYFVGKSEPVQGWQNKDFNDSNWEIVHGSIGYGDNDDTMLIDTTTSVYLRSQFRVSKNYLNKIMPLVINADFDDGFIAYLNGYEI